MLAKQLGRYFVVGSVALAIHLGVLSLLVEVFALNATLSTGTGFVLACVVNYLLQQAWVFRAEGRHKVYFARYVLVTSCTLALNLLLFWLAHSILGFWYLFSQIMVTGFIFLLNFAINRWYTFNINHGKHS